MFVEPTPVQTSRRRTTAAVGIALAGLAAFAAISTFSAPDARVAAPSGPPDAVVAPVAGSAPRPSAAAARPSPTAGIDAAELRLVRSTSDAEAFDVAGWVPEPFGWALVDVLVGGIPVSSAVRQAGADGTFTATVAVPGLSGRRDGILVLLHGLRDGAYTTEVLGRVAVGTSRIATWPLDRRTVIPR